MLPRPEPIRQIELTFQRYPVITLLGPRQRGKTTLARYMAGQEPSTVFDLDNMVFVHLRREGNDIEYVKTKDGFETELHIITAY